MDLKPKEDTRDLQIEKAIDEVMKTGKCPVTGEPRQPRRLSGRPRFGMKKNRETGDRPGLGRGLKGVKGLPSVGMVKK